MTMVGSGHSALFEKVLASECGLWAVCQKDHRSYTSVSARQMLNDNWREKGGRSILVVYILIRGRNSDTQLIPACGNAERCQTVGVS